MKKRSAPALNVVGGRVKWLREDRDLSQAALAELLHAQGWNAPRSVVAKIETFARCVTDYELLTLARALHITVPELFADAPEDVRTIFKSAGK